MREGLALLGRHVRCALRGRGARLLLLGAIAILLTALLLTPGGQATASTSTVSALWVVGVLVFSVAAWSGSLLPSDRAEGRDAWLSVLAPSGALQRLSATGAGIALAMLVALAGCLAVGVFAPLLGRAKTPREWRGLTVPTAQAYLAAHSDDPATLRLDLGPPATPPQPRSIEVAIACRYASDALTGTDIDVGWQAGSASGQQTLPLGTPLRLDVAAGERFVTVENRTPFVDLRVTEVLVLGEERSFLVTLLLSGLLLGLAAAALVPAAVAVSRLTSGPTAAAAALVLGAVGGIRPFLDELFADAHGWFPGAGLEVAQAASRLAPDLTALGALSGPGAGRALYLADFADLAPLLVYGLVGVVLVLLPLPRVLLPSADGERV